MMGRNSARHAWVPVGSLKPYDGNVRQHNRHQRRKIFKLVDQIGMQIVPVIVTPDLEIIDGHALYETMRERGAAEVFVAILENQSPAEIKALRLAINRVPQDSRLDKAGLKKEISGLIELSFDLELTGFDVSEIDSILRIDIPEANVVEDEESIRLTDDPVAQTGDIFQ